MPTIGCQIRCGRTIRLQQEHSLSLEFRRINPLPAASRRRPGFGLSGPAQDTACTRAPASRACGFSPEPESSKLSAEVRNSRGGTPCTGWRLPLRQARSSSAATVLLRLPALIRGPQSNPRQPPAPLQPTYAARRACRQHPGSLCRQTPKPKRSAVSHVLIQVIPDSKLQFAPCAAMLRKQRHGGREPCGHILLRIL